MRKFTFKIITLLCLVLILTVSCSKEDSAPEVKQTTKPDTEIEAPETENPETETPETETSNSDVDGYIIINGTKREYKNASGGGAHPNYVKIVCEEYDHNIYISIFGNGQKSPTETTTYKTKAGNPGLKELTSEGVKMVYIQGFFVNKLYGAVDSEIEVVTVTIEGDKMRVSGKEIPIGNGKTMELDISIPVVK